MQHNRLKHKGKLVFAYSQNTKVWHVHPAEWLSPSAGGCCCFSEVSLRMAWGVTHQRVSARVKFALHLESWTLVSAEWELTCWSFPDAELYVARSVSGCNGVSRTEGLFLMHGVGIRSARLLKTPCTGCVCVCVWTKLNPQLDFIGQRPHQFLCAWTWAGYS